MFFAFSVYIILSSSKFSNEKNSIKDNSKIDNQSINEIMEITNNDNSNGHISGKVSSTRKKDLNNKRKENSCDNNGLKKIDENVILESDKSKILLECFFSLNLWLLMLVGGLTTFVLKSMADWTGLYLVEHSGFNIRTTTELMLWNEIGGMTGTLICGILSDRLGGNKYLTSFIFVIICIPAMLYFPSGNIVEINSTEYSPEFLENYFSITSFYSVFSNILLLKKMIYNTLSGKAGIARLCLFIMGFGINGPKTLLGIMVRDLVPRGVSGTIGGIYGLVSQVGASVSGAGKNSISFFDFFMFFVLEYFLLTKVLVIHTVIFAFV